MTEKQIRWQKRSLILYRLKGMVCFPSPERREFETMNYKGFEIKIEKYIEKRHPQYNYLSFTARCGEKYLNAVFHDIDMRLKSEDELLEIFLKRLDSFIEYNTNTSAPHLK